MSQQECVSLSLCLHKMHQNLRAKGGDWECLCSPQSSFIGWLQNTLLCLDMTLDLCFRKKN